MQNIIESLEAKAASSDSPHEKKVFEDKAKALREKYDIRKVKDPYEGLNNFRKAHGNPNTKTNQSNGAEDTERRKREEQKARASSMFGEGFPGFDFKVHFDDTAWREFEEAMKRQSWYKSHRDKGNNDPWAHEHVKQNPPYGEEQKKEKEMFCECPSCNLKRMGTFGQRLMNPNAELELEEIVYLTFFMETNESFRNTTKSMDREALYGMLITRQYREVNKMLSILRQTLPCFAKTWDIYKNRKQ